MSLLGSADAKEDLEGVPVSEPGDAFPAVQSKDQLLFGELKDTRPPGEPGARWQLLFALHNHSRVLGCRWVRKPNALKTQIGLETIEYTFQGQRDTKASGFQNSWFYPLHGHFLRGTSRTSASEVPGMCIRNGSYWIVPLPRESSNTIGASSGSYVMEELAGRNVPQRSSACGNFSVMWNKLFSKVQWWCQQEMSQVPSRKW